MKLKDIRQWSERWSAPFGTMEAHAPVATVCLSICLYGERRLSLSPCNAQTEDFGSLRASGPVYNHVLELLERNQGRNLREVMDAEIDISDSDSIVPWPSTYNAPVRNVVVIWESLSEASEIIPRSIEEAQLRPPPFTLVAERRLLYKELNSPNKVISNVKDFHQLPQGRFSWLCTRHLRELVQHFSKDRLFMDVDTVEPGVDFVHAIEKAVDECGVLVALIGKR